MSFRVRLPNAQAALTLIMVKGRRRYPPGLLGAPALYRFAPVYCQPWYIGTRPATCTNRTQIALVRSPVRPMSVALFAEGATVANSGISIGVPLGAVNRLEMALSTVKEPSLPVAVTL